MFPSKFPIYQLLSRIGIAVHRPQISQREAEAAHEAVGALADKMGVAADTVAHLVRGNFGVDHIPAADAEKVRNYLSGALLKPSTKKNDQGQVVNHLLLRAQQVVSQHIGRRLARAGAQRAAGEIMAAQTAVASVVGDYNAARALPAGPAKKTAVRRAINAARQAEAAIARAEDVAGGTAVGSARLRDLRVQLAAARPHRRDRG